HQSPLENYLIEIFTYCLKNDNEFTVAFTNSFLDVEDTGEQFEIKSQMGSGEFGRPDILMRSSNTIVVIECKVESSEGNEQLIKYTKYLNSQDRNCTKKYLIYLTKYFDPKKIDE